VKKLPDFTKPVISYCAHRVRHMTISSASYIKWDVELYRWSLWHILDVTSCSLVGSSVWGSKQYVPPKLRQTSTKEGVKSQKTVFLQLYQVPALTPRFSLFRYNIPRRRASVSFREVVQPECSISPRVNMMSGDNMNKEAKKLKGQYGTRPLWTV
jgi:hypothetical protein